MADDRAMLVVGGDGLLGRALVLAGRRDGQPVVETTRRHISRPSPERIFLDLCGEISNWQPPAGVSVAFICAAVSSLEACRRSPRSSRAVNVRATLALARRLAEQGVFVVFPSTNLVFDGSAPFERADARPSPTSEYGRQKAEAESQLAQLGDRVAIVRFSKIMPPAMPLLVQWIGQLRSGRTISPFADVSIAPLPLEFATETLRRAADERLAGILQVSAQQSVTYEEVAKYIARRYHAPPELVQATTARRAGVQYETIPTHTTLDTSRLRRQLGVSVPDVWATVDYACGQGPAGGPA